VDFTRRHQGNVARPQQKRLAFGSMTLDAFGHEANVEVEVVMAIETGIRQARRAQHEAGHFTNVVVTCVLSHGTPTRIGGEEGQHIPDLRKIWIYRLSASNCREALLMDARKVTH
jgi:hypothetical protein